MRETARVPLNSLDVFEETRKRAKANLGKLDTNCYMGAAALAEPVSSKRASIQEFEQGFLVFIDEGAYDRLFYFLQHGQDAPFPALCVDKPVVLEELDSNDRRQAEIADLGERLAAQGWKLYARNLQVAAKLQEEAEKIREASAAALAKVAANGIGLCPPDERLATDIVRLWKDHLRTTDVPGQHFSFLDDPEQHVVCAVDANGVLCGVNWWEYRNRTCEIRHTVTHPDYLHRGIAFAMLTHSLTTACEHGCEQAITYIDDENVKSLGLYAKAGITPNGRTSTQFILE